jgi:hypothetical protein
MVKCGVLFEVRAEFLNIYTSFGFRGLRGEQTGLRTRLKITSILAGELYHKPGHVVNAIPII